MRECRYCGEVKDLTLFNKNSGCTGGITHKCKDCHNSWYRDYYAKNSKTIGQNQKRSTDKRRSEGKDVNKPSREYARRNPHYKRYYAKQRQARERRATPNWLTVEQKNDMRSLHFLRNKLEKLTGVSYHVDHIVPINGKNICGLNVPWNLQILEASLNLAKSNKYS